MSSELPFPEANKVNVPALFEGKVTKERIAELSSAFLTPYTSGDADPLKAYIEVKAFNEYLSNIIEQLAPMALNEAEKWGKDTKNINGVDFEVTNGAKKYDFSHCSKWRNLHAHLALEQRKLKDHEELMIKALSFSGAVDEDGVVIEPAKIVSAGKTTLRVTIPKK